MQKLKKYIDRPKSVLTNRETLENLYALKDFPVFMGCVEQPQSEDIVADMQWAICRETGIIQLRKLVPLEVLYLNQHNEGVGKVWQEHYTQFCEFLKKYNPKNVLEIGGANGLVAKQFTALSPDTRWTIVEPNPTFDGDAKIEVIKGWFDEKFTTDKPIDTVVHSHVLEHVFDPASYMQNIGKFLKNGDLHIFTFPNLVEFLKRKYTNGLNFEHTIFITEHFTDYLLGKNGFNILEKQYFRDDHSIFYATQKSEDVDTSIVLESKYEEYKKLFLDFVNYHGDMVNDLNEKIKNTANPVYLFGAHIFSQFLIGFGLETDKIISVLDNGPLKQGKRLYGTRFMVESPKVLVGKGKVNIILKAGQYNEEIKKDILENINDQSVFW